MLSAALIGAACIFFGIAGTVNVLRARQWPVADGVVLSSEVRDENVGAGEGQVSEPMATVRFGYFVAGRKFESDRLHFSGQVGGSRHPFPAAAARAYSVGTPVRIAYNPLDPSDAVLLPIQTPWGFAIAAVVGIGLLFTYIRYVVRLNHAPACTYPAVA
jgi:hypothetical protein